jgi:glycine cleavage system H lipoate-binding protein
VIGITINQLAGQEPTKISYDCLTDNISDIVKGKKKSKKKLNVEGTVRIQPHTQIAHIYVGETVIKARGLIDGQVVEFNEKLLTNPKLLL